MERLTERNFEFTSDYVKSTLQSWSIAQALKKLQEYENKEEDGLLIELPCKVGTTIYIVHRYWNCVDIGNICGIAECDDVDCFCFKVYVDPDTYTVVAISDFGKEWFLTEAEAEEALAKMGGNDHEQNYQGNT